MVDREYMTGDRRAPSAWRRRLNAAVFPPAIQAATNLETATRCASRSPLAWLAAGIAMATLVMIRCGARRGD